jgi:hypothetical protein
MLPGTCAFGQEQPFSGVVTHKIDPYLLVRAPISAVIYLFNLAHKTCDFKEESSSGMMSADLVSSFKTGQARGCSCTYLHFASGQIAHFWGA